MNHPLLSDKNTKTVSDKKLHKLDSGKCGAPNMNESGEMAQFGHANGAVRRNSHEKEPEKSGSEILLPDTSGAMGALYIFCGARDIK